MYIFSPYSAFHIGFLKIALQHWLLIPFPCYAKLLVSCNSNFYFWTVKIALYGFYFIPSSPLFFFFLFFMSLTGDQRPVAGLLQGLPERGGDPPAPSGLPRATCLSCSNSSWWVRLCCEEPGGGFEMRHSSCVSGTSCAFVGSPGGNIWCS